MKPFKNPWKSKLILGLALFQLGLQACTSGLPITTLQGKNQGQEQLKELALPSQALPTPPPVSGELQGTILEPTEEPIEDKTPTVANILVWEVKKPEGKPSYFVGTVHTRLAADFEIPALLKEKIETTDLFVMEANLDNLEEVQNLIAQLAFDTQQDLKKDLSEMEWQTLLTRTRQNNIPEDLLGKFRPWYLNLALNAPARASQPDQIMDQVLRRLAAAQSPTIGFLETAEEQLLALSASLTYEEALELLKKSLAETPEEQDKERNEIFAAYNTGDLPALEAIDLETRAESEKYYTALVENRNIVWAQKIEKRLSLDESLVVVVGALHLIGPRSLLKSMEALGYTVRLMSEISKTTAAVSTPPSPAPSSSPSVEAN